MGLLSFSVPGGTEEIPGLRFARRESVPRLTLCLGNGTIGTMGQLFSNYVQQHSFLIKYFFLTQIETIWKICIKFIPKLYTVAWIKYAES